MTSANPDRARLLEFLERCEPMEIGTSPSLEAMCARLERYESDSSTLTMSFLPSEFFRQGAGVIQGGAMSMMLDYVMAFSAMAAVHEGSSVVTVSMSTDFLGAATGDEMTAVASVDKAGKQVVFARSQLMDGERLAASAHATLLVVPSPQQHPQEATR